MIRLLSAYRGHDGRKPTMTDGGAQNPNVAKLAQLRRQLSQCEGTRFTRRLRSVAMSQHVLRTNHKALLDTLNDAEFLAGVRSRKPGGRDIAFCNLATVLLNYIASARAIEEHARKAAQAILRDPPRDDEPIGLLAQSGDFALLVGLRNMLLHNDNLPISVTFSFASTGPSTQVVTLETEIILRDPRWKKAKNLQLASRTFQEFPEGIPVGHVTERLTPQLLSEADQVRETALVDLAIEFAELQSLTAQYKAMEAVVFPKPTKN